MYIVNQRLGKIVILKAKTQIRNTRVEDTAYILLKFTFSSNFLDADVDVVGCSKSGVHP